MFWLVESEDQFNRFCNSNYKEAFVEVISYDNRTHPTKNKVCAVYIRPLLATKGFIIPTSHSETLNINIDSIMRVLSQYNKVY